MSLMERTPKDFYKLFSSKYTDYYMLFLTAIYEENESVLFRAWIDGKRVQGSYE